MLPKADLHGANLYGADLTRANLSGADLIGADLTRATLSGADLIGADLTRANLYGANLSEADLSDATLSEANLSGANLSGADLFNIKGKRIITYQDGQHQLIYADGFVKIGCKYHTLSYWIHYGVAIGKAADYSDAEIDRYMSLIRSIKDE